MAVELSRGFIAANWPWITGTALTMVLVYWTIDEREDARDAGETIQGVTDRAESAVGGVLGGSRAAVLGLIGILGTVVVEVLSLVNELNGLLDAAPLVVGQVVIGVLRFFGADLGLEGREIGYAIIIVGVISVLWAAGSASTTRRYS